METPTTPAAGGTATGRLVMRDAEQVARVHDRQTAALWYAWGRQDADPSTAVDAMEFADHYSLLTADHVRGLTSYLPSIQDAWRAYRDAAAAARLTAELTARLGGAR